MTLKPSFQRGFWSLYAILMLALIPCAANAHGLDSAGRKTLAHYSVTENVLANISAITRAAKNEGLRTNDAFSISDRTVSLHQLTREIQSMPELMKLIRARGMNVHDFVLGDLALMQSAMTAQGGGEAQLAENLLGKANAANVGFYNQHARQVGDLLDMGNERNSDSSMKFQLSDKDKKQLAQMQKMVHSGKFKECIKISTTLATATYPFTMAAATSHYNIPGAKLEPGTLTKSGKLLEKLGANVADQVPGDALKKLGRQVELQEGHHPIEITPVFKAQLGRINDWLEAHCNPHHDESAASTATANTATARVPSAPSPVSKTSTDAPGVTFGELSEADAEIVHTARGIQVGKKAGKANIQIIFDPNAPYAARLYRTLHKSHPQLSVRWVPVAYMAKNSAAVASLLLHSRTPRQDLNTDLFYFDFARGRGGVQPGSEHPDPLPAEQSRLLKALHLWGGYTPMIIFRDQSGRWLRTGGSGSKVIDSVLARAVQ